MIDVHIIRAFEGQRHDLLYNLWTCVAEFCSSEIRLIWYANSKGLCHADCLNRMWVDGQDRESTRMILTEADFLPNLINTDRWLQAPLDNDKNVAFAGAQYFTRAAGTRKLVYRPGLPGAWFLSFAKRRCPKSLNFHGRPDPANDLPAQFPDDDSKMLLFKALDEYPRFLSVSYPWGTHLFWSRHLNDDPRGRVSGFSIREIQTKHDRRVRKWLHDQPAKFRKLFKDRHGSLRSES